MHVTNVNIDLAAAVPVFEIIFQSNPLASNEFFFVQQSTNIYAWVPMAAPDIQDTGSSNVLLTIPAAGQTQLFAWVRIAPLYCDTTATNLPSGLTGLSMDAATADFDCDGDIDIAIANEFQANFLLLNNGSGSFEKVGPGRIPQINRDSEDVAIADFDKTNGPDIVVVSEDDFINEYYINDGSGFFSYAGDRLPATGRSNAVVCGDIDKDGDADLIIGNNGQSHILINDGAGFFTNETAQRFPLSSDVTQDIELGDGDDDEDLDLIVANEGLNVLLLNDGDGCFSNAPAGAYPRTRWTKRARQTSATWTVMAILISCLPTPSFFNRTILATGFSSTTAPGSSQTKRSQVFRWTRTKRWMPISSTLMPTATWTS